MLFFHVILVTTLFWQWLLDTCAHKVKTACIIDIYCDFSNKCVKYYMSWYKITYASTGLLLTNYFIYSSYCFNGLDSCLLQTSWVSLNQCYFQLLCFSNWTEEGDLDTPLSRLLSACLDPSRKYISFDLQLIHCTVKGLYWLLWGECPQIIVMHVELQPKQCTSLHWVPPLCWEDFRISELCHILKCE